MKLYMEFFLWTRVSYFSQSRNHPSFTTLKAEERVTHFNVSIDTGVVPYAADQVGEEGFQLS